MRGYNRRCLPDVEKERVVYSQEDKIFIWGIVIGIVIGMVIGTIGWWLL